MPKKKKLSESEMIAKFQQWKQSDEYKVLEKLKDTKDKMPPLLEITEDLCGKWQILLDIVLEMGRTFKVKGANLKSFEQEQLRTAFFGGVHQRDEPFEIDDFQLDYENKEFQKTCRHVKVGFVDILKQVDNLDLLDHYKFEDFRKNKIVYKFKEFANFFKDHIKKNKGHQETQQLLNIILNPLKQFMEINQKLFVFEQQNQTHEEILKRKFYYNTLIKEFCLKYQPCQDLLYKFSKKLQYNPDIYSILKKLHLENWKKNNIENFYIQQLQDSFNQMRANLLKLYTLGMNHWKQPISKNEVLLEDVKQLTEIDHDCEFLFGDHLKRDQTNFLYKICKLIFDSKAKQDFLDHEENIFDKTIPYLCILESMIRINDIFKEHQDYHFGMIKKRTYLNDQATQQMNYALYNIRNPDKPIDIQSIIPQSLTYSEEIRQIGEDNVTISIDDNNLEQLDQFGRFFIWINYIKKENQEQFIKESRKLRYINRAIINDIQDYIIVTGMQASGKNYIKNRTKAKKKMNFLNELIREEVKENIPKMRPPYTWNDPDITKVEHNTRFSTNIFNDYDDPEVHEKKWVKN